MLCVRSIERQSLVDCAALLSGDVAELSNRQTHRPIDHATCVTIGRIWCWQLYALGAEHWASVVGRLCGPAVWWCRWAAQGVWAGQGETEGADLWGDLPELDPGLRQLPLTPRLRTGKCRYRYCYMVQACAFSACAFIALTRVMGTSCKK